MTNFKTFTCIIQQEDDSLENQVYQEKEINLISVKSEIDINEIETFTEFINDDGEKEDYTMVYMKSGNVFCVEMAFDKFKGVIQI